jgi:signal transduction histidine kinase
MSHWSRIWSPLREGWRFQEEPVLREQVKLIARNIQAAAWGYVLGVILLVVGVSDTAQIDGMVIWGVVAMSTSVVVQRAIRSLPLRDWSARRQGWMLMFYNATLGLVSGAVVLPLTASGSIDALLFAAVVVSGLCAGELAFAGSLFPAFMAYVVPQTLPLVWTFFAYNGEFSFMQMGWAGVFYVGCIGLFGIFTQDVILQGIRLRFENLALIERLQRDSQELTRARAEAEDANRAKSRFLAAASHDLRQPLHALGLFLETLSRATLPPRETDILGHARTASGAAHQMLNTLLDFSRLEAGVLQAQARAFELQPLLAKLESELGPLAEAKGLAYRSRATPLAAQADPALVELIMRNLVSNAIRYTPYGGVLVGARARAGCVVIEVWDTGVGIAPENQAEIFREFRQLGNPERDHCKGLGLGLAIVEGLCNAMGTHVELSSVPGRGSMFRLTLPSARAAAPEQPTPLARLENLAGKRILTVDDDESVRRAVQGLLADWGCACEAVESLAEAQAAARRARPDLLIVDYRLRGEQTGAHVIAALRQLCGRGLPAVIVTGDTAPARLREAQAAAAVLLHKPLDPAVLRHTLCGLLESPQPARAQVV